MGETRVDLEHLLEDIRDAYPGSLEETIVTEIVANALDSGASSVRIETDPTGSSFTLIDDGSGMTRRELARHHDIPASTKSRGEGIGFAGVGIELGILASTEVYTETRHGKSHVATSWRLASRHKAPWRWTPPLGLLTTHAERATGLFEVPGLAECLTLNKADFIRAGVPRRGSTAAARPPGVREGRGPGGWPIPPREGWPPAGTESCGAEAGRHCEA